MIKVGEAPKRKRMKIGEICIIDLWGTDTPDVNRNISISRNTSCASTTREHKPIQTKNEFRLIIFILCFSCKSFSILSFIKTWYRGINNLFSKEDTTK